MKPLFATARTRLAHALGADEPAGRVAAAWALGVAIGFSPLLGAHTLIALALAFVFRLNKIDVLLGTFVINPWTFPVYIFVALQLGGWITGVHVHRVAVPHLEELLRASWWSQHGHWLLRMFIPWGAGSTILACIAGLVTYALIRRMIERHRRRLVGDGRNQTPAANL